MKKFPLVLTVLLILPTGAFAQSFGRQGIFDCNQNGAYAMSVGALGAIGGAYVPVADAAVELNTGILVYKECVLREVVDRQREAATAQLQKQMDQAIKTGRYDPFTRTQNPLYVVNEARELVAVSDAKFVTFINNNAFWNTVHPNLQTDLKQALTQWYEGESSGLQAASLKCPYQGDVKQFQAGQKLEPDNFFVDFYNASSPQCYSMSASALAKEVVTAQLARSLEFQKDQWNWGAGFYARTDENTDPLARNTVTPAALVHELYGQMLQSPLKQLESANDIGQIIGALYAGLSTQIVGSSQGLTGISQAVGSAPSYIDQVVQQAVQGVRDVANYVGQVTLTAPLEFQKRYTNAVVGVVTSLLTTGNNLRSAEKQCWNQIIAKVCAPGSLNSSGTTCTSATASTTLAIATSSTPFAQRAIETQIQPLLSPWQASATAANQELATLTALIASIGGGTLAQQNAVLLQIDQLTTANPPKLHATRTAAETAEQQLQVAQGAASDLQSAIAKTWAGVGPNSDQNLPWDGSDTPGTGWCNVNNQSTLNAWIQRWQ